MQIPFRSLFRYLPAVLVGAALGMLIAVGSTVLAVRDETDLAKVIPFDDLRTFAEVFSRIKNEYVEEVPDKVLIENAIQGMLSGLDPHSGYLDPEAYQDLQVGTSGEFGGLGIEVGMDEGFVKVIAPIDDTPAQRAGIQTGDLIIRLDDTPVKGLSLTDAVKRMRGKPGSKIKLTIVRETEDKPITLEIVRDIIQVKSVKSRTLEPGYGYIRITHFQTHTADDLEKSINDLKKDNKKVKGLILDLRNNPGGVLNAAVAVADTFLTDGLIVYTEGRVEDAYLKFKARAGDALNGAPMVVLVNGGSASASEIVAGALQDHKRAVIMGNKTFGKGSVQTILPMNNHAALKLTTARYYTPLGRSIQAQGIQPDIVLSKLQVAASENEENVDLKEADLIRHLRNKNAKATDTQKPAETPVETTPTVDKPDTTKPENKEDKSNPNKPDKQSVDPKSKEPEDALAKKDYALYEALNLLKGLSIIEERKS